MPAAPRAASLCLMTCDSTVSRQQWMSWCSLSGGRCHAELTHSGTHSGAIFVLDSDSIERLAGALQDGHAVLVPAAAQGRRRAAEGGHHALAAGGAPDLLDLQPRPESPHCYANQSAGQVSLTFCLVLD